MTKYEVTPEILEQVWGKGLNKAFIDQTCLTINTYRLNFGLSKRIDLVRFFAQCYHEIQFIKGKDGRIPRMQENLNFSDKVLVRLSKYWRENKKELKEVRKLGKQEAQRVIMNKWYNGRMGNRVGTDDGYTYVGHGALMITGRDNHQRVLQAIEQYAGVKVLTDDGEPIHGVFERFDVFWLMGMAYWRLMGGYTCNSTLECTNKVNRGLPAKEKQERTQTAVRLNRTLWT